MLISLGRIQKSRGIRLGIRAVLAWMAASLAGCERGEGKVAGEDRASSTRVVVYTSVDEPLAHMVLDRFTVETGVEAQMIGDAEASKTTGLVNRILSEMKSGRPRADVFWSGEIFNTIRLAREGALEPYDSPSAADVPARFRDPRRHWTATAVRARVVAFDPQRISSESVPSRWDQWAESNHASRTSLANPLFGTTSGQVAAMFLLWGDERARAFLEGLRGGGARIEAGNSAAVRAVIDGRSAYAFTDTDDVWVAQRAGASIDLVYPDLGGGGTLLIPCTVALVRGSPNVDAGRKLIDFLVSAEVERMLAQSDSRNIPVRVALREELGLAWPAETPVDYHAVAEKLEASMAVVREVLLR